MHAELFRVGFKHPVEEIGDADQRGVENENDEQVRWGFCPVMPGAIHEGAEEDGERKVHGVQAVGHA